MSSVSFHDPGFWFAVTSLLNIINTYLAIRLEKTKKKG